MTHSSVKIKDKFLTFYLILKSDIQIISKNDKAHVKKSLLMEIAGDRER